MRCNLLLVLSTIVFLFVFTSCQKEISYTDPNIQDSVVNVSVDDGVKVTASVNGVITDENGDPVSGAIVKCGSQSVTTNTFGTFYFKNIAISKNNGSVVVNKSGYFKGFRNFLTSAGKSHFLRIQLLRHDITATIPSSAGGTVDLGNGASIVFPANAFAYSNGTLYSGNVKVFAKKMRPEESSFHLVMPGDLRGIQKNGKEAVLSNYGIIGSDFTDESGNVLVIAANKKASLEFPVPVATPDSISLWHFDESRARWIQEGTAIKSNGKVRAEVSKFSFWAINTAAGFVRMSCVIMNSIDSTPVVNQLVRLTVQGTNESAYGYTACTGFIMGGVPVNKVMQMDIVVSNNCGTVLDTRNIGPFSSAVSLDTIWIVAPTTSYTLFTGYIKNCQGGVASNGYISLYSPSSGSYIFEADSATGYFTLPVYVCQNTTLNYSYQVTEFGTSQQSPVFTGSSTSHVVNLGNVYACTTQPTPDVYVFGSETPNGSKSVIKYWKNGVATTITDGTRSCYSSRAFITSSNDIYIAGVEWDSAGFISNAKLWKNGTKTHIAGSSIANADANDVFVNGSDVYVAFDVSNLGTGLRSARLWKNGTVTVLSNDSTHFYANCVYVAGNDVYVGGQRYLSSITHRAVIWKNGVAQYLSSVQTHSQVNKILVVGNDVYAVGQDNLAGNGTGRAVIWKNGQPTYLTDGINSDAMANDIFIEGTDVYVCGRKSTPGSGEKAQLWKNGVATVLSANGSNGIAHGVFVKNGDVYVSEAGFMSGPVRIWKNGLPTLLTSGLNFNSVANVIVK